MTTIATPKQVIVGRFRSSDETDIIAMNLEEYGPRDIMVSPEAFHWRFTENPAGPAEITTARDIASGKLIGFTWTIPIRIRMYGNEYVAALTANQLIHPEYRNTLAYARISRHRMQWLRQKGIPFRYNFPTEAIYASVGTAEKMSSFLIPLLARPVNPVRLGQMIFSRRWLGLPIGWGAKAVTPLIFSSQPIKKSPDKITVEQPDRFDERFDSFWERVRDKYAVMAVRDQAFLAWRFAPIAGRTYRIMAAMAKDELIGYAVLRITDEIRRIPVGLVMDLLLEPSPRGESAGQLLLAESWGYFQTEKVWLAGGLALPHTAEFAALSHAGYRSIPDRWAPRRFRVAFNCFDKDLPETSLVKRSDLFFSIADYESH